MPGKAVEYGVRSEKGYGFDRRGVSRNPSEVSAAGPGFHKSRGSIKVIGGYETHKSGKPDNASSQTKGFGGQTKGK